MKSKIKIEIGSTYRDSSVPSEPLFVVEGIQCDIQGIPAVASGHYVGNSGPSYAFINELRAGNKARP